MSEFKVISQKLIDKVKDETKCLFYGFTFNGDVAFCRESYLDTATGLLIHLANVGSLIEDALKISRYNSF